MWFYACQKSSNKFKTQNERNTASLNHVNSHTNCQENISAVL